MDSIIIKSKMRNYEVKFVDNFMEYIDKEVDFFIIDQIIKEKYIPNLNNALSIPANEYWKSFEFIKPLIMNLLTKNIRRNSRLVAIGGGTIQDITGFIASILFRGIDWIFIPTTLLAQADSCIGSKTSINLGGYKNQLGTFYPPSHIYIDFRFLDTLSEEDMRSGLGEIIKIHLLGGIDMPFYLQDAICSSLQLKKHYIEIDETDKSCRNLLNYGHTFGHALESLLDFEISHGEAVVVGMDIANYISCRSEYIDREEFTELHDYLKIYFPKEFDLDKYNLDDYIEHLKRDKKNINSDELVCILTRGRGKMFKGSIPYFAIRELLGHYVEEKLWI